MTFSPRDRSKVVSLCFPELCLNGEKLAYVKSFKYLGNIIAHNNMDDADIQREITNVFICTNTLTRKFGNCKKGFRFGHTVFVCMMLYCGQDFMLGC